jgi:hypothetical protein
MAKGSATMPTITPALKSARNWARVYPLSVVNIFGTNASGIHTREPLHIGACLGLSTGIDLGWMGGTDARTMRARRTLREKYRRPLLTTYTIE